MTTQTLYACQLCAFPRPAEELYHDGKSFITCIDAAACVGEIQRQGYALEAGILSDLQRNNTERSQLLNDLVRVRHEYMLPDKTLEHHRAEMARISAE